MCVTEQGSGRKVRAGFIAVPEETFENLGQAIEHLNMFEQSREVEPSLVHLRALLQHLRMIREGIA